MVETSAEPSLQAKQLKLKRARLADDLNEKIAQRPGPMELVEKNILPVECSLKEAIIGEEAGEGLRQRGTLDMQQGCTRRCERRSGEALGRKWNPGPCWPQTGAVGPLRACWSHPHTHAHGTHVSTVSLGHSVIL